MSGGKLRVFIAVDLSGQAKTEIGRHIAAIQKLRIQGVRTARPDGMHITVRFLGDVGMHAIPDLREAIRRAASRIEPFGLALGRTGAFPDSDSARVLWVGVDGDVTTLRTLHTNMEEELSQIGFRGDGRRFNPHITVARVRDRVNRSDRLRLVDAMSSIPHRGVAWTADAVVLFSSTLHPDGSRYDPLYRSSLGG